MSEVKERIYDLCFFYLKVRCNGSVDVIPVVMVTSSNVFMRTPVLNEQFEPLEIL